MPPKTTIVKRVPDYDASDRQTIFHTSPADETLYGGAAGGGKTAALVAEGVTICLEYPGIPVYIFRRTIPELKRSVLPEVFRQCAEYMKHGHMKWEGTERRFSFKNGVDDKGNKTFVGGSTLNLAYCDTDADVYLYQGAEMPVILIDEVTHWPFAWYEYLRTRNRRPPGTNWPIKMMMATNPGNVGHGWVKQLFIVPTPWEKLHTDAQNGATRLFVPAKVDDHPDADFRQQYAKKLEAITDPHLRRALRDGDWDQFEGQVFTEWRRDLHVVDPFEIPDHWQRWFGYDWGIGNGAYAAGVWFARDPGNNRIYAYREFYETGMITSMQAVTIQQMEQEEVRVKFGDPSIFKSRPNIESTETISDIMAKVGLKFIPANNNRSHRVAAWHEALGIADDGLPRLQVFSNCYNLIRTLPDLPYDKNRKDDVDTEAEDHLYDAGGYALVGARPAKKEKKKITRNYDPVTGRLLG